MTEGRGRTEASRVTRLGPDHAERVRASERRIAFVARLLDGLIEIPGTGRRVGLDPIVGLVPWVGDLVSAGFGAWIVLEAGRFGLPRIVVARMIANVAIDFVVGAVPLIGDVFDFAFSSNQRNLELFRRHANEPGADTSADRAFLAGLGLVLVGLAWLTWTALSALYSITIG